MIERECKTENTKENLEDTATRDLEHTQTDAHYTTDTANVKVEVIKNSDVKTEKRNEGEPGCAHCCNVM